MNLNTNLPLEIINIFKQFKNQIVLDDISLVIKPNHILGLLGLNGIGKTTLIKIILDLLRQDSGQIKLFNENNKNVSSKAKLAYLPEKFNPSPYLRGEEFLSLAIAYYDKKYSEEEALSLCKELDFDERALKKRISSYSKGMGQKLGLISVFMTKAPLLILDEPMSGLDPRARIALKNKLKEYKNEGHSIFFSSHILSDIEEICDNIAVLHNGKIIFEGRSDLFVDQFKSNNLEIAFLNAIGM